MSEKTNQEKVHSPEELAQLRKDTIKFYSDKNEVLEVHCKAEEFKARIKKAQFEALEYTVKLMQLSDALKGPEEKNSEE